MEEIATESYASRLVTHFVEKKHQTSNWLGSFHFSKQSRGFIPMKRRDSSHPRRLVLLLILALLCACYLVVHVEGSWGGRNNNDASSSSSSFTTRELEKEEAEEAAAVPYLIHQLGHQVREEQAVCC
jgi:hypothetical protein